MTKKTIVCHSLHFKKAYQNTGYIASAFAIVCTKEMVQLRMQIYRTKNIATRWSDTLCKNVYSKLRRLIQSIEKIIFMNWYQLNLMEAVDMFFFFSFFGCHCHSMISIHSSLIEQCTIKMWEFESIYRKWNVFLLSHCEFIIHSMSIRQKKKI